MELNMTLLIGTLILVRCFKPIVQIVVGTVIVVLGLILQLGFPR